MATPVGGESSQAVLGDGGHRPLLVAGRTEQVEAWFRPGPAGPVTGGLWPGLAHPIYMYTCLYKDI